MKPIHCCALLIGVVFLTAGTGWADGCFISVKMTDVGQSKSLITSPKQEAILATDGGTVQVVLRTHFSAGPKELAWIVPVPGMPEDVRKADDSIFDRLQELTAPSFVKIEFGPPRGGGLSFGCGYQGGDGVLSAPLGVRVEKTGIAGIFDFQVLSADRADDLLQWLDEHNYRPPEGAARALAPYVQKKWRWLAIRVRAQEANRPTLAPHPITYRYKNSDLVFPLIISTLSAADETEIVLYVVGPGYFGPMHWTGCTCQEICNLQRGMENSLLVERKGSPSGTNYGELFRQKAGLSAGRLLVTELAQPWQLFGSSANMGRRFDDVLDANLIASIGPRQAITRLRALVRREQMDQDIALVPQPDARDVSNQIKFTERRPAAQSAGQPATAGGAALGLAAMSSCAAGGLVRSRRRGARAAKALLLVLGLAVFAVM